MKGSFESKDGTKRKAISLEEWNAKVDAFIESENSNVGNTAPLYYIFRQDSRSLSRAGGAGFYNETVTADSIGRFARAIGDTNPLWSDPDYAAGSICKGIVAPPMFECCIVTTFVNGAFPRLKNVQMFDGGTKWERISTSDRAILFQAMLLLSELPRNQSRTSLTVC